MYILMDFVARAVAQRPVIELLHPLRLPSAKPL